MYFNLIADLTHSPQSEFRKIEPIRSLFLNQEEESSLVFDDRPLRKSVNLALFSDSGLLPYDFQTPRWVFQDGEPDDFAAILLLPRGKSLFIAEPHYHRGDVYQRSLTLMEKLGEKEEFLFGGNGISTDRLIEKLREIPDHTLTIQIIAPCPTLSAIMKKEPELLAQKIKRMIVYGGFVYRDSNQGTLAGQKVYYTTFNHTVDLEASQTLFDFAEKLQVPLYVISGDNLKLPRKINYDLPYKFQQGNDPSSEYISDEIEAWRRIWLKGKESRMKELIKECVDSGYLPSDLHREMTPADTIAEVFDLAFDQLEISTRGFSQIHISDEPRYDDKGIALAARAVFLNENHRSSIRYLDGFRLKGTQLNTSQTFQILLNHLINIRWHEQMTNPPAQKTTSSISRQFFHLQGQLEETIVEEAKNKTFDYPKRIKFFADFSSLQQKLNSVLSEIKEGTGDFAGLSPLELKELYAFAALGRGAESVRIFSKVPIILPYDHPEYGDKIMALAHDDSHFLDERMSEQTNLSEKAKTALSKISDQLPLLFPKNGNISLFTRGMIGSGKTSLLAQEFGIDEMTLFSSDTVKLHLGGDLSHHEAVALADDLLELNFPNMINVKTNIRERNNASMSNPKEGTTNIILDIAVSREVVEQRLKTRGGRSLASFEIEEGLNFSLNNRIPLIRAALENGQIEWHLYDNNGEKAVKIASIVDRKLEIHDPVKWQALLGPDWQF